MRVVFIINLNFDRIEMGHNLSCDTATNNENDFDCFIEIPRSRSISISKDLGKLQHQLDTARARIQSSTLGFTESTSNLQEDSSIISNNESMTM